MLEKFQSDRRRGEEKRGKETRNDDARKVCPTGRIELFARRTAKGEGVGEAESYGKENGRSIQRKKSTISLSDVFILRLPLILDT